MADEHGMTVADSDEFPVVRMIGTAVGELLIAIGSGPLSRMSPPVRDQLFGSVLLKIALTLLSAGGSQLPPDKIRHMVEFYLTNMDAEIAQAMRDLEGGKLQ